jgi:hypothetical protein
MTEVDPETSGSAGAGFIDTDLAGAAGAALWAGAWNEDQAKSANVRNLNFMVMAALEMVFASPRVRSTHQSGDALRPAWSEFGQLRIAYQEKK